MSDTTSGAPGFVPKSLTEGIGGRLTEAGCKNEEARRASVPVSPEADREVAWVIEADSPEGLAYWTGRKGFAPFHTEAVRFLRRVDAIEVMATLPLGQNRVVQHLWVSPEVSAAKCNRRSAFHGRQSCQLPAGHAGAHDAMPVPSVAVSPPTENFAPPTLTANVNIGDVLTNANTTPKDGETA